MPFIPKKYKVIAFGFILSGMMSCFVSGLATLINIGFVPIFFGNWPSAWLTSWLFSFPIVLCVAPLVRRILRAIVIEDE
ncbi:MAG: DUF2798 domain-containing protein [Pseudomonadota bacterium]